MKTLLVAAALGALSLLPAHATAQPAPRTASVAPAAGTDNVLGVYFHADAVGSNMRMLAVSSCGTERWPVKTMTDYDRALVHLHAEDSTIRALRGLSTPASRPQAHRAGSVERHTYRLHARLTSYVREADGDYHLVLTDPHGRTLVAEIPNPACVGAISPVKHASRLSRQHMDAHYAVTTGFKDTSRRVVVRGVGFFDFLHGQNGMAPNGLELHPVTGLRFPA